MSYDFSSDQHGMVLGEEIGDFLERMMDSAGVASHNESLEIRNRKVIRWLEENKAPEELI